MKQRSKGGFARGSRVSVTLLVALTVAAELCACSRTSSRTPEADAGQQANANASDPTPSAPIASASVPSAPVASTPSPAAPVASAQAPKAPASSAAAMRSDPWTTAVDCNRLEQSAESRELSPESRARSHATCEAKEELRGFVATRQSCSTASDCSNVSGACPFGCFIPVTKGAAPDVAAKLSALGTRLDKAGHRCTYRCMAPPAAACTNGRCTTQAP